MHEPILIVECDEPGGKVKREVRLAQLSLDRLAYYYDNLSKFDVIFNDYFQKDPKAFLQAFISVDGGKVIPTGILWEVDDVGLLYITDIREGYEATVHYTFWDRRFRGREPLVKAWLHYLFSHYGFHRLVAEVPLYVKPAMAVAERIGFVKEGRKRKVVMYKGQWFDANLYSLLEEEVLNGNV